MTKQRPSITPPPELVEQWTNQSVRFVPNPSRIQYERDCAALAAQWGADQELEACLEWLMLNGYGEAAGRLRTARCSISPSLAEQGLDALRNTVFKSQDDYDAIFAALKRLADLEAVQDSPREGVLRTSHE